MKKDEAEKKQKANVPEQSDMAKYKAKNGKTYDEAHITNVKKEATGYTVTLSEIGKQQGGLVGSVPYELGFEPKKGMFAIWDGSRLIEDTVNLSFYDSDGEKLFEMKRKGLMNWKEVYLNPKLKTPEERKKEIENGISQTRKRLAQKIDNILGTNISDVKVSKTIKKAEKKISQYIERVRE